MRIVAARYNRVMRIRLTGLVVAAALLATLLAATLWWVDRGRGDWLSRVPPNTLALVVLREIPADLDFLTESRLGEWFDTEGLSEAAAGLEKQDLEQLLAFGQQVHSGWVAVHRVERKTNGALRPHLSGLLRPRQGAGRLQTWLEAKMAERFTNSTLTVLDDGSRLIEGQEEGQSLYMQPLGNDLLVANSADGWMRTRFAISAGWRETEVSLQEALARPATDWDLLVFFRGPAPADLVPPFLYLLDFERPAADEYAPIPKSTQTRQISW